MSLRWRLILLVAGLTTALLLGLGLSLGKGLEGLPVRVLDDELSSHARKLAKEVEIKRSGELELEELMEAAGGHLARLEEPGGRLLWSNPPTWPGAVEASAQSQTGYGFLQAPPGERWRVYSLVFRPKHAERLSGSGELVLRVADRVSALETLAGRFQSGLLMALALGVLLGGVGATALAQWVLRPVRRLSAEMAQVEATSLDRRLDEGELPRELRPLATAFNGALERLGAAFERQKAFVARASHALRTPTASILAGAEVALRKERSPEEYRAALADVVASARESSEKIAALLAMVRAESRDRALRSEAVSLEEVGRELHRLFAPRALEAGLQLCWEVPAKLELWANREALRELLEALLDNALRYTPRNGQVGLRVRLEQPAEPGDAAGHVALEVWDTGPGIPASERAQAIEPFYRGSAATASGAPGSGLGLSIAQAIVSAHGATLTLGERPGGGLSAVVRWPRARGALERA